MAESKRDTSADYGPHEEAMGAYLREGEARALVHAVSREET